MLGPVPRVFLPLAGGGVQRRRVVATGSDAVRCCWAGRFGRGAGRFQGACGGRVRCEVPVPASRVPYSASCVPCPIRFCSPTRAGEPVVERRPAGNPCFQCSRPVQCATTPMNRLLRPCCGAPPSPAPSPHDVVGHRGSTTRPTHTMPQSVPRHGSARRTELENIHRPEGRPSASPPGKPLPRPAVPPGIRNPWRRVRSPETETSSPEPGPEPGHPEPRRHKSRTTGPFPGICDADRASASCNRDDGLVLRDL